MSIAVIDYSSPSVDAGQPYHLVFVNKSPNNWYFMCFQKQLTGLPQNYATLAWFVQPAAPNSKVLFTWEVNYNFVWAQTGSLAPGVVFTASQTFPADLQNMNQIGFTKTPTGAFAFQNQTAGENPGTLVIQEDSTVPLNQAAVGIGMSGVGSFAVPAQPNIDVTFTPTPQYWVAFGQSIQPSEVMNISQFSQTAQISFPINVYTATATLEANNQWNITYEGDSMRRIRELQRHAHSLLI